MLLLVGLPNRLRCLQRVVMRRYFAKRLRVFLMNNLLRRMRATCPPLLALSWGHCTCQLQSLHFVVIILWLLFPCISSRP
ncbi:hypothetical protein LINPERHAP1_LOCUS31386 [Linum perenne]